MVISQLECGPVRLQMKEFCVLCLYSWRASHQLHPQRLVNWCSYRPFTTFCTASITIDFPTLKAGQILEYEFPWAKRYRPKSSTFSGGKQFLNLEFFLSGFGPRMFLLNLNCCRKYSCGTVGSLWWISNHAVRALTWTVKGSLFNLHHLYFNCPLLA